MSNEKRLIADTGYEVKQSIRINCKEILFAENPIEKEGMYYLVGNLTEHGIIAEYSNCVVFDDFLEAMQEFTERVKNETLLVQTEHEKRGLPAELFTDEHCYPNNYAESIEGKVVVIKSEVFSPEYRRGEYQLFYATRGNGAGANPTGHAVYGYQLNTGSHTRFERFDVMGVLKELPDWARERLDRIIADKDKPSTEKQYVGNYEITDRIEVGNKVYALGYCPEAPNPYGTWQGYKQHSGFDWGHYFNDRETALTDLNERAAKERDRINKTRKRDDAR